MKEEKMKLKIVLSGIFKHYEQACNYCLRRRPKRLLSGFGNLSESQKVTHGGNLFEIG